MAFGVFDTPIVFLTLITKRDFIELSLTRTLLMMLHFGNLNLFIELMEIISKCFNTIIYKDFCMV